MENISQDLILNEEEAEKVISEVSEIQQDKPKIIIPKFEVDRLQSSPFRMVVFGSSQSGKTYYIENIIWPKIKETFDKVVVFTQDYNNNRYKQHFSPQIIQKMVRVTKKGPLGVNVTENIEVPMIYNNVDEIPKIIESIKIQQMADTIKKKGTNENRLDENGNPVFKYDILLIFDDIIDEKLVRSDDFRKLFGTLRNVHISTIFIIQSTSTVITPFMKNNTNIFVLCKMTHSRDKSEIFKIFEPALDEFLRENMESGYDERNLRKYMEKVYKDCISSKKYGKLITDVDNNLIYAEGESE